MNGKPRQKQNLSGIILSDTSAWTSSSRAKYALKQQEASLESPGHDQEESLLSGAAMRALPGFRLHQGPSQKCLDQSSGVQTAVP